MKPTLSFIIPLMNEAGTLVELYERIAEQANVAARDWEIIFIDDGSRDGSWEVIQDLSERDPAHVQALRFRTNIGKAGGLAAGYAEATGEYVFTLDADLQDDPGEIPRFIEKLEEGWDIVSGYKQKRHDPWHKVLPSRVFNLMLSKVNGVSLHDHNCGFKLYRREVVKELPMYGEMHRMVPSLASISGYKTTEVVVQHHPRVYGESKYGVKRFARGFLDMWSVFFIKNYRERPLHLMGGIGITMLILGASCWALALLPFITGKLALCFLVAAPALACAAPILFMIGFLSDLMNHREYSRQRELPISERIERTIPGTEGRVIPMSPAGSVAETAEQVVEGGIALVADDDPITRSIVVNILEKAGWQVEQASSAEAAQTAMTPVIDVVFLDIYMTGITGLDILPRLKAIAPFSQVVIVSGSNHASDGAAAIKGGAFEFVSKPIQPEALTRVAASARQACLALRPAAAQGSSPQSSVKMGA